MKTFKKILDMCKMSFKSVHKLVYSNSELTGIYIYLDENNISGHHKTLSGRASHTVLPPTGCDRRQSVPG